MRERAGLVKRHYADAVGNLQGLCIFDQDAVFGRHPGTGHDGHRRGQAQCARAGNHQHRHCTDQSHLYRLASRQPAQQSQQRQHQHNRHKHGADLVYQTLNRRLGGLRVLHQADDVGQHRLPAHGA